MKIAVCILTYKRMEGIRKALLSLSHQRQDRALFELVKIVVVDNDVNGEVESLCSAMAPLVGTEILYQAEHRKGISYGRNTAVAGAIADVDCIAFLDDDEEACADWLYELVCAMAATGADIVTGNINSILGPGTPDWVAKGRFYDRFAHRDLDRIDYARTGNVLIRSGVFHDCGRFDEKFALTGGEDTVFFRGAHAAGKTIVWSSKALVHETVEENRCNVKWILTRAFRVAGTNVISGIMVREKRGISVLRYLVRGSALVLYSLLLFPISAVTGFHAVVKAMTFSATGLGTICGAFGYHHQMYRTK